MPSFKCILILANCSFAERVVFEVLAVDFLLVISVTEEAAAEPAEEEAQPSVSIQSSASLAKSASEWVLDSLGVNLPYLNSYQLYFIVLEQFPTVFSN